MIAGMIEKFKEFTIYTRNLLRNCENSTHYILSEMYQFSNNYIKPDHATGICWMDHNMKGMLDKYGA